MKLLIVIGIICLLVTVILVPLVLLLIIKLQPPRHCPGCGLAAPRFRKPSNPREALHGGWTCSACGTPCDRHGQRIPEAISSD